MRKVRSSHIGQGTGPAEENKTGIEQKKNPQQGKAVGAFKLIRNKGAVQVERMPERKIKRKPKKAPEVNFTMFGLNGNGADKIMAFLNQFEVQFMINYYQKVVETGAENIDYYLASDDHDKLASYALAQQRLKYWEDVQLKSE